MIRLKSENLKYEVSYDEVDEFIEQKENEGYTCTKQDTEKWEIIIVDCTK